ncbi:MAG: FHA domain-containing protein [Verrucomicrobiales bacterium]|nr:FHA domain-containing protein [Verrucomicrobiales bacterium]
MITQFFKKVSRACYPPTTTSNLVVCIPGTEPVQYVLNANTINLGRSRNCSIRIREEWISRRHCELTRCPRTGNYIFQDLKTLNGTRINGVRTAKATLKHGDFLQLGGRIPAHFLELPIGVDPDPALFENNRGARPLPSELRGRSISPDDPTSRVSVKSESGVSRSDLFSSARELIGTTTKSIRSMASGFLTIFG